MRYTPSLFCRMKESSYIIVQSLQFDICKMCGCFTCDIPSMEKWLFFSWNIWCILLEVDSEMGHIPLVYWFNLFVVSLVSKGHNKDRWDTFSKFFEGYINSSLQNWRHFLNSRDTKKLRVPRCRLQHCG
jgi:hypothetical protein